MRLPLLLAALALTAAHPAFAQMPYRLPAGALA
jgi:hypothetical protein